MILVIQRRAAPADISTAYSPAGQERFWMDCYRLRNSATGPRNAEKCHYDGPDAESDALKALNEFQRTNPSNEYRIVALVEVVPASLRLKSDTDF